MSISAFTQGKGVAPDVEVVPTLEDFLAGKDRALEVAKARVSTSTALTTK